MKNERYSHRERLQMIIAGERPDRHAASFWRHFFHMEHHADGLAEAMLGFQKEFDWDFMKVNPRADYHIEDWGLKQDWSHNEFKKHTKHDFPVSKIEDWARIKALPPTAPVLTELLQAVSMIRKGSDKELPILMTVFTPLAIAGRMVEDRQMLVDHIRSAPDEVEKAVRAITDTFVAYASELRNAGADGLFYATTQWASSDMLTWEEYERFGVPFDLEVIRATESDAINLLHVCASNNYLDKMLGLDYHASLHNWDCDDPTNLPLDKAEPKFAGKVMVGGVDHNGWLLQSDPEEVGHKIDEIKDRFEANKLIIGPGCAVPPEVPLENFRIIRDKL